MTQLEHDELVVVGMVILIDFISRVDGLSSRRCDVCSFCSVEKWVFVEILSYWRCFFGGFHAPEVLNALCAMIFCRTGCIECTCMPPLPCFWGWKSNFTQISFCVSRLEMRLWLNNAMQRSVFLCVLSENGYSCAQKVIQENFKLTQHSPGLAQHLMSHHQTHRSHSVSPIPFPTFAQA